MKPGEFDPLRLTKPERESRCWEKVETWAQARLKELRATAENPRAPEADRLGAAWRIDALKELLRLAEPAKEQPDAEG